MTKLTPPTIAALIVATESMSEDATLDQRIAHVIQELKFFKSWSDSTTQVANSFNKELNNRERKFLQQVAHNRAQLDQAKAQINGLFDSLKEQIS